MILEQKKKRAYDVTFINVTISRYHPYLLAWFNKSTRENQLKGGKVYSAHGSSPWLSGCTVWGPLMRSTIMARIKAAHPVEANKERKWPHFIPKVLPPPSGASGGPQAAYTWASGRHVEPKSQSLWCKWKNYTVPSIFWEIFKSLHEPLGITIFHAWIFCI